MANVAFKKGLLANLPNTKAEGTIYITTDERAIYLDVDGSNRIRLGDFQEFATVAALEANTNPSTTALYYVTAINCLAKWDGSKYVQINLDTGATSIEVVGDGNAVTAASYDAATRKITLTKGATYMTESDVDGKITALDLANTYYSKSLGEANASAITAMKDGESIDSFGDVETALEGKQDTIPANTYDAYGAAAAVLGSNADSAGDATVYGANKAAAAAQAAADAKVASVGATSGKGIEIGGTATVPTVGIKLAASDNDLSFKANGELVYKAAAAVAYSIVKDATSADYAAVYHLTADGVNTGVAINIPKDMVVESGSVVTNPEGQPAGTYIKLVLANADNDEIFINVGDLIEYVTSGSQAGDMVVISIDDQHRVTASITDGTITLAKLASAVQTEIGKAHEHSNKALLDTYSQTEADLADAVSKKHSHSNAAVLDGISAADVSNWNGEIGANAAITAMKDGADIDSFGDVETALNGKQDELTFDSAPTSGSSNPVTSGGVYTAIQNAALEWGSF